MILADLIRRTVDTAGDCSIIHVQRDGTEQTQSYSELYCRALSTLAQLQNHGALPGRRVVLQLTSSSRQLEVLWACFLGGIVPALLPKVVSWKRPTEASRRLEAVTGVLHQPMVLVDADQAPIYASGQTGTIAQRAQWLADDPESPDNGSPRLHECNPADVAYLQFSSGSTGTPKGVCLSHANLLCNIEDMADAMQLTKEDTSLSWMPYFHDMGLVGFHLTSLLKGSSQVKMEATHFISDPLTWLRKAEEHRATLLGSPNFGLQHVLDKINPEHLTGLDLSRIRVLFNGAEPISANVMQRFCDLLAPTGFSRAAMCPVYGMAEACLGVTFTPVGQEPVVHRLDLERLCVDQVAVAARIGFPSIDYVDVGYALSSVQVRIVSDHDQIVPDRQVGHIQIRGPNVTSGYEGVADDASDMFTKDGWLRTGDLGFFDDGRLSVAGRSKDVIFVHGRNVMAADLEREICERCAVKDGTVAVCATPDPVTARDQVVIFVTARHWRNEWPRMHEIRRVAEEYLSFPVKCVVPLALLPRTTSGKLQRFQLAEQFARGTYDEQRALFDESDPRKSGVDVAVDADPTQQVVQAIWADVLGQTSVPIGLDRPFLELGGTSVKAIEMLARIEEHCGRSFGYELLLECRTVREVSAYITRATPPAKLTHPTIEPVDTSVASAPLPLIAVIGMAGRFPGSASLDDFWMQLLAGASLTREVPSTRWRSSRGRHFMGALQDVDRFAADFFAVAPDEAAIMDPQQRLMLEIAYAGLDDAGYSGQRLGVERQVGVYIGASHNAYLEEIQRRRDADPRALSHPQLMPLNLLNMIAARVAHALNLRGPAQVFDTACSSSLIAIHHACNDLLLENCDIALAGGVSLLTSSSTHELFAQAGALSESGVCRAFDEAADGMVPGEGLGLLVLKRLDRALLDGDRIDAVIDAVAVNNDGRSIGIMAPTPEGQEAVIRRALKKARVAPEQISYVETHGTGTPIGDPIEFRALAQAFGKAGGPATCGIGSVKTNVGHLLAAAGVVGIIKVLLALRHEQLPPMLNLRKPHARVKFVNTPFFPVLEARPWPRGESPRYAGISSFGFGGTNAHVILHDVALPPAEETRSRFLLAVSARNAEELARMRDELAAHLQRNPKTQTSHLCYTSAAGRHHFGLRQYFVIDGIQDAVSQLAASQSEPANAPKRPAPVALLFGDHGALRETVGDTFYGHYPTFTTEFDRCAGIVASLRSDLGNLRDIMTGKGRDWLADIEISHAVQFSVQYALARQWQTWGVKPAQLFGHGIGEYAAACIAGILQLDQALALVLARAHFIKSVPPGPPGTMLAVQLRESEVLSILDESGIALDVAAVDGNGHCTLAGTCVDVETLGAILSERGINWRQLAVSHAYHSRMMRVIAADFLNCLQKVSFAKPSIPMLASLAMPDEDNALQTAAYWVAQLAEPVRFADTIQRLNAAGTRTVLEIASDQILGPVATSALQHAAGVVAIATPSGESSSSEDERRLLSALGELWTAGVPIDWRAYFEGTSARITSLPSYPFTRQRYWLPPTAEDAGSAVAEGASLTAREQPFPMPIATD